MPSDASDPFYVSSPTTIRRRSLSLRTFWRSSASNERRVHMIAHHIARTSDMGLSRTMQQVTRHSERIARHGISGPRVTHWMGAVWQSRGGCATRLRAAFVRTVTGVHRAGCSQGRVPFSTLFTYIQYNTYMYAVYEPRARPARGPS